MFEDELASAITKSQFYQKSPILQDTFIYANYVSAETVDPDLSIVELADGTQVRGCPKNAAVTGLTAGALLMMINPGSKKPLTILMRLAGDPTKFEA